MLDICAPRAYGAALQMRIIRIARGRDPARHTCIYIQWPVGAAGAITGGLLMTNRYKRMLDSSTPFPYNVYIELSQLEPKG